MHGQKQPGRKFTPPDLLAQPPPDLYALYNKEETSRIPGPVVEWFTSYSSLGPSWNGGPAVLGCSLRDLYSLALDFQKP